EEEVGLGAAGVGHEVERAHAEGGAVAQVFDPDRDRPEGVAAPGFTCCGQRAVSCEAHAFYYYNNIIMITIGKALGRFFPAGARAGGGRESRRGRGGVGAGRLPGDGPPARPRGGRTSAHGAARPAAARAPRTGAGAGGGAREGDRTPGGRAHAMIMEGKAVR